MCWDGETEKIHAKVALTFKTNKPSLRATDVTLIIYFYLFGSLFLSLLWNTLVGFFPLYSSLNIQSPIDVICHLRVKDHILTDVTEGLFKNLEHATLTPNYCFYVKYLS